MADWQPIDTAPKDGTIVDLWVDNQRVAYCSWEERFGQWMRIDQFKGGYSSLPNLSAPTYWMPLPEPPHEKS